MSNYYHKYLKYKTKYLQLQKSLDHSMPRSTNPTILMGGMDDLFLASFVFKLSNVGIGRDGSLININKPLTTIKELATKFILGRQFHQILTDRLDSGSGSKRVVHTYLRWTIRKPL